MPHLSPQAGSNGAQKGRQVGGLPGGDEVTVHHHLRITVSGPGMDQVVLDGKEAGDVLPAHRFGAAGTPGPESRRQRTWPTSCRGSGRLNLTIREGRKIARTEATIDQVYPGRAAMGGGGVKGTGLFIFRPIPTQEYTAYHMAASR